MSDDDKAPIIVKKIKKGGHAAHGGAWKVAYADFVTAMMAFFLLLWLLTATPAENLKGLADYFSPTLGLQGKMGIGFSGGQSPDSEGASKGDWADMSLVFGAPPSGPIIKLMQEDNNTDTDNIKVSFDSLSDAVEEALEDSEESINTEQNPLGLKIQIVDKNKRPMFEEGSDVLKPHAKKILAKIAYVIKFIPNYIQITGHTNFIEYKKKKNYTNWELSTDRANATRRYLIKAGIPPSQIAQVIGKANQEPLLINDPNSRLNDRVSLTLLRKSLLAEQKLAAPDEVLLGEDKEGLDSFVEKKKKSRYEEDYEEEEEDYEEEKEEKKEVDVTKEIMKGIVKEVVKDPEAKGKWDMKIPKHSPEDALDFSLEDKVLEKKESKEERRRRLRKEATESKKSGTSK